MSSSHDCLVGRSSATAPPKKMLTCQQLGNFIWSIILILAGHMSSLFSKRGWCSALCVCVVWGTRQEAIQKEKRIVDKSKKSLEEGEERENERSNEHEIRSCCIIMACRPSLRAPGSVGSFQSSVTWLYQAAAVLNQQYQSATSQRQTQGSIVLFFSALRHALFYLFIYFFFFYSLSSEG